MGPYQIRLCKESLKFSAAHITVFPDGSKERLHGHNYKLELKVNLRDASLKNMLPFALLKEAARNIAQAWDERVLLAEFCPFLEWKSRGAEELDFLLCGKRYVLPTDEVILLPLENITSENLASEACRRWLAALAPELKKGVIERVEVFVEESWGQGASFAWNWEGERS